MWFFGKKRKKDIEIEESFAKVYEEIETIENLDDPKKFERYILDSCEQIIGLTKEIEAQKAEYRIVTAYLRDIQAIENLPPNQLKELKEVASNIEELHSAKASLASRKHQISESHFLLMEQEQENVPATIRRMLENERYQDTVRKEKLVLEGKKSQWEIERESIQNKEKGVRNGSIVLFMMYAMLFILLVVIGQMSDLQLDIAYVILLFIGGVGAFLLYLSHLNLQKQKKHALRQMNQAISLLNVVNMKYVNVTKAIEYTKDKYDIQNSTELNFLWDEYLALVRQQEKILKNNDDLEYFMGRLMRLLQKVNLYDRKIWLSQTKALIDDNEMVEIRHNLVRRRQKIREHIDENRRIVQSERNEIDDLMNAHEQYVPEIIEIINSVDKLCGLQGEV